MRGVPQNLLSRTRVEGISCLWVARRPAQSLQLGSLHSPFSAFDEIRKEGGQRFCLPAARAVLRSSVGGRAPRVDDGRLPAVPSMWVSRHAEGFVGRSWRAARLQGPFALPKSSASVNSGAASRLAPAGQQDPRPWTQTLREGLCGARRGVWLAVERSGGRRGPDPQRRAKRASAEFLSLNFAGFLFPGRGAAGCRWSPRAQFLTFFVRPLRKEKATLPRDVIALPEVDRKTTSAPPPLSRSPLAGGAGLPSCHLEASLLQYLYITDESAGRRSQFRANCPASGPVSVRAGERKRRSRGKEADASVRVPGRGRAAWERKGSVGERAVSLERSRTERRAERLRPPRIVGACKLRGWAGSHTGEARHHPRRGWKRRGCLAGLPLEASLFCLGRFPLSDPSVGMPLLGEKKCPFADRERGRERERARDPLRPMSEPCFGTQ